MLRTVPGFAKDRICRQPKHPARGRGRRRFPLRHDQLKSQFRIGTAAVVLMVILRMSVGSHFLYEGVWKIKHPEFTAEGFLTQAKGPAAWIFRSMVPDIDGRERLKIERALSADSLVDRWRKVRDDSEARYTGPYRKRLAAYEQKRQQQKGKLSPQDEKTVANLEDKIDELTRKFRSGTEPILWKHEDELEAFLADNERAMLAFFAARKGAPPAGANSKESDQQVKRWLSALNDLQNAYLTALKEFGEQDKDAQEAIARSCNEATPVFDEHVVVDKLVEGNRLRDPKGKEVLRVTSAIRAEKFYRPWNELKQKVIRKYGLDDRQQADAEVIYRRYKEAIQSVLAENQADIAVYFKALDRFDKQVEAGNQGAAYQKQRAYDQQQKLRAEVGVWLAGLKATQRGYQNALAALLTEEQARQGALPVAWTRMDLIDFAVTYGLTAIGLCLLLGLFTRPAAVAGGLFMLSVVLMQPAWPSIYPPDPAAAGHALLINKDFVEMMVLFTLAATAVGRWGGLDYFVENYVLHLLGWAKHKTKEEKKDRGNIK
jgi:uncharacterized membrane protein YphA (DoxX/SURF4 family)